MESLKTKKLLLGFILLLVLAVVGFVKVEAAGAMTVTKGSDQTYLCPRETGLFTDTVMNTDTRAREFTVTTKGSAAAWSTAVPNGFVLMPGESKTIYTYVTPVQNSIPANYDLSVMVTSEGNNQDVAHTVVVKKCYGSTIASNAVIQRSCPNDVVKYEMTITNNGEYKESFVLNVDGQIKDRVTLSDKIITLEKAETKKIYAYVNAPKEDGGYAFSVKSVGQVGRQLDSFNAVLNVDPCYNFEVAIAGNNSYSICERSLLTIPIKVENKGTTANTFSATVNGPQWARFDRNQFILGAGQKEYVNLLVAPTYGVNGDFKVGVKIVPALGDLKANSEFNFNVRKCHSVSALFLEQNVSVCNGLQKTFDAVVTNDGEVAKQYAFNVEAPNWVTSSVSSAKLLSLNPGQQEKITFTASPNENVNESVNGITLKVNAIDDSRSQVYSVATTSVYNVPPLQCYKPSISTQFEEISVYYDSTVTLPLAIKNEGSNKVSYDIVLSGTASNFVKLVPAVLSVDAGKSETAYLYIAPTPHFALGQYDAIISLKIKDGSFLLTRRIPITVTDDRTKATSLSTIDNNLPTFALDDTGKLSRWQRFKSWFFAKWETLKNKARNSEANLFQKVEEVVPAEVAKKAPQEADVLGEEKDIIIEGAEEQDVQKPSLKEKLIANKQNILIVIVILLVLIILIRLEFFKKLGKFLDDEE